MRLDKLRMVIGLVFIIGSVVTAAPPTDGKIIYLSGYDIFDIEQKICEEDPILISLNGPQNSRPLDPVLISLNIPQNSRQFEIVCRWGDRLYWKDLDLGILYCLEYGPDLERQIYRIEKEFIESLEHIKPAADIKLSDLSNKNNLLAGSRFEKSRVGYNSEVFGNRVNSENVELNRSKNERDIKLEYASVSFRSRDMKYRKLIEDCSRKISQVDGILLWIYPESGMLLVAKSEVDTRARSNGKKGRSVATTYYVQWADGLQPILNSGAMNESCDLGYSFADDVLYYVNTKGELIEKNVVTATENVVANLSQFIEQQNLSPGSIIHLGPGSPDRQYIPVVAKRTLYLVDRRGKIRRVTGPLFGFYGYGVDDRSIFWDKKSRFIIFSTLFDWFPSFDFINGGYWPTEVGYYNTYTGEIGRIDTGSRQNRGFWFTEN